MATSTKKAPAKKTAAKKVARKTPVKKAPAAKGAEATHPLVSLRDEMDRLFERFAKDWPFAGDWPDMSPVLRSFGDLEPFKGWPQWWGAGGAAPKVDFHETDKAYEVSAELPGMDEKDVEVVLQDNLLTLKGEKKEERKDKEKGDYHITERRYGSFRRSFTVPPGVDAAKVKAKFSKGVLSVTLPKTKKARLGRKVSVKSD